MKAEVFWDDFLDALESALEPDPEALSLRELYVQGRLWQSWCKRPQRAPEHFQPNDWASNFMRSGLGKLELDADLSVPRKGDPWLLELLCRSLLALSPAGSLHLSGDPLALWLRPPPGLPMPTMKGPLLQRLSWSLSLEWTPEGIRVPCPLAMESTASAVDFDSLRRTTMDDPEFERELIETFLSEGRHQLESLQLRYASNILHSFRGSASMVGARKLTELLAAQEKQPDPAQLGHLQKEFEAVSDCLRHRLQQLHA